MRAYRLAPAAVRDLEAIVDLYALERQNPSAARRVLEAVRAACQRAGEDPLLGRRRPELGAEIWSKVVLEYPYIVYFRTSPATGPHLVQIIRVMHQSRDVHGAFGTSYP